MPAGPDHRTLTAELRGWSDGQLACLLLRRPDLLEPDPPANVDELAQRAQYQPSIMAAISSTTLPENRLLQLIVCVRPDAALDELARALPDGVSLADIEPILQSLEQAALVWRYNDRVHCSGTLRECMPTTLGPALSQLANAQTVEFLKHACALVRGETSGAVGERALPPPATGPAGRPPRKAELVAELEALLTAPGVVDSLLASAPTSSAAMARSMAEGSPVIRTPSYLYYSRYDDRRYANRPEWWLFSRALLLPDSRFGDAAAAQPRCIGVALRGGKPLADLSLARPPLAVGAVDPVAVDAHGAARARATLERLADILDQWAVEPAKQLKSGGLGVSMLRQLAAGLDVTVEEAGRLVELLSLAGLLADSHSSRKQGRQWIYDAFVHPSDAAPRWLASPVAVRWRQVAVAWLRAAHWPSATGRKDRRTDKVIPVLSPQYRATDAPARRAELLAALGELGDGDGTLAPATSATVAAGYSYWARPQPWLDNPPCDPLTAAGWIYEEACILGLVADGRLSTFGSALIAGKVADAERSFEASLPEPVRSFVVQADMTVVAVGDLARDVATELRLIADVEARGEATTYRMSEPSVRRAIDAGRDGEAIVRFLEEHAAKGVPRAVAYTVRDVARRHGHLRVAAAATVVHSDDPAVLADACTHKRTRKLKLRTVAATVAVSPLPPDKVITGLRDAGFFPAVDDSVEIELRAAPSPFPLATAPARTAAKDLPEPFRTNRPAQRVPATLPRETAAALAATIRAGVADPPPSRGRRRPQATTQPRMPFADGPFFDDLDIEDDLAELEAVLGDEVAEIVFIGQRSASRGRRRRR